jgi:hypothetical protein
MGWRLVGRGKETDLRCGGEIDTFILIYTLVVIYNCTLQCIYSVYAGDTCKYIIVLFSVRLAKSTFTLKYEILQPLNHTSPIIVPIGKILLTS